MTEKVKVSQEVAKVIKGYMERGIWTKERIIKQHVEKGWGARTPEDCFNEVPLDDLIIALYIGYEVEPEYKKGQYVVHDNGELGKKTGYSGTCLTVEAMYGDRCIWLEKRVRHATESEIAQEKERRFFASHGRKPWELREGDVLQNKHTGMAHIRVVAEIVDGEPRFEFNETGIDYKRNFHVVCFAENRLDY